MNVTRFHQQVCGAVKQEEGKHVISEVEMLRVHLTQLHPPVVGRRAGRLVGGVPGLAEVELALGAAEEGIEDMIAHARYQDRVLNEWGFGKSIPYDRALRVPLWVQGPGLPGGEIERLAMAFKNSGLRKRSGVT